MIKSRREFLSLSLVKSGRGRGEAADAPLPTRRKGGEREWCGPGRIFHGIKVRHADSTRYGRSTRVLKGTRRREPRRLGERFKASLVGGKGSFSVVHQVKGSRTPGEPNGMTNVPGPVDLW